MAQAVAQLELQPVPYADHSSHHPQLPFFFFFPLDTT